MTLSPFPVLLMLRSCAVFLALLTGCGDAPAPNAVQSPPSSPDPAGPVEVRLVADDPAVQQRLSPPQLLTFFPDALGALQAAVGARTLKDSRMDDGRGSSSATVRYRDDADRNAGEISVYVSDFVDDPMSGDFFREQVEDARGLDPYRSGTTEPLREIAGGLDRGYTADGWDVYLHLYLADRFGVTISKSGGTNQTSRLTPDDLRALYRQSGLARLAGAPTSGELGAPDVPAWAARAVREWEAAEAEAGRATPEPVAEALPLPACDALLPAAEVARLCGIPGGARAVPTDFEQEGENCNRFYKASTGPSESLAFIATRYSRDETARQAARVADDRDASTVEHARLPDLGSGGVRLHKRGDALGDRYTVAFSERNVLVEVNANPAPYETNDLPVCASLDQLEAIARQVAARLQER